MPTATLDDRVSTLERRMSDLEGQVGYLIPLMRQIHLDLLGFKEDVDRRFEAMDAKFTRKFDGLESKFDRLDAKVDAMPRAVAEIVVDLLKK